MIIGLDIECSVIMVGCEILEAMHIHVVTQRRRSCYMWNELTERMFSIETMWLWMPRLYTSIIALTPSASVCSPVLVAVLVVTLAALCLWMIFDLR